MSAQQIDNEHDERPKSLKYGDRIQAVEEMIVNALPDIAAKLIAMAKEGHVAAARYLFDRMAGRPSRLPAPPSIDRTLPYSNQDWAADLVVHKDRRERMANHSVASILARPASDAFPGVGLPPTPDILNRSRRRR